MIFPCGAVINRIASCLYCIAKLALALLFAVFRLGGLLAITVAVFIVVPTTTGYPVRFSVAVAPTARDPMVHRRVAGSYFVSAAVWGRDDGGGISVHIQQIGRNACCEGRFMA
jgi:hypothetical protein